jgi:hypothetical protein
MFGRRPRTLLAAALLGLSALSPALASAGEPSAADKETARSLLIGGREKFAAKDYKGALDAFAAAYKLVQVPTTGLDLAKAQAAVGLLVEARTTALEAARMPEAPREPTAFRDARQEASALAEGLGKRIPSLLVKVQGLPAGAQPAVKLDGEAVPAETLAFPRKVNPGAHEVVVGAAGHAEERRKVDVKEAETAEVTVALRPTGAGLALAAPGPAKPEGPMERKVPGWAWVSLGVGSASIVTGVAFFIDVRIARGQLAELCEGSSSTSSCELSGEDFDRGHELSERISRGFKASLVFGSLGVVGVAAGVVGIALAPKRPVSPSVSAAPWFGPGTGGVVMTGKF